MSDTLHPQSPDTLHYNLPDDRAKRRTVAVSFSALSLALAVVAGVLAYKLNHQNAEVADLRAQVEKAEGQATKMKSDLAAAGSTAADFQGQLDRARHDQAELQAQAKQAGALGTGLQTELDKARADLKAQQEKAQTELTAVQNQARQVTATTTGLNQQIATLKSENEDLKNQLTQARAELARQQPVTAEPRVLPLTTENKKSFFGNTFTLRIRNPGTDALKLSITITGSPNLPARSATIEPGGTVETKDLAADSRVSIASEGYSPMSVTIQ